MKNLATLKKILDSNNYKTRFYWFYDSGFELTDWGNYFSILDENYIEIPFTGPIENKKLKWIEINPIEEKFIGRLVPSKRIDHTKELIENLNFNKINFNYENEFVKIENENFGISIGF